MTTGMSRLLSQPETELPARHGATRLWGSWHASCLLFWMNGGCLYVEPVWEPPLNRLPALQSVQPEEGVLVFTRDIERISVIVRDPESDPLQFIWTPPPFAIATPTETNLGDGLYLARLDIEWTPDLEGEDLVLTILDPEGAVDVFWTLEDL